MCLATPVKVEKITGNNAIVEGGKKVDISLVPDLAAGDFLLVHANLAINKISKKEAGQILELAKSCHHYEEIKTS